MTTITVITIVVVALLTVIIFGLMWLAYGSCVKAYRIEAENGKHDHEIFELRKVKSNRGAGSIAGAILSYLTVAACLSLFVTGIVYRVRGENLGFNGQTALVIKSGSMSAFYDDILAETYRERGYDLSSQFGVGDICFFVDVDPDAELKEGDIYGYRYKGIVVTHRLIGAEPDGSYEFRGDNNPASDGIRIARESIVYHYTGNRIQGLGAFVLYSQSYFGMWSLVGILGVAASSEFVQRSITKINKERYAQLGGGPHEK